MVAQRLSKICAAAGVASRRACEDLIRAGRVTVNGTIILEPQHQVEADKDNIMVDDRRITLCQDKVYYLLNKPTGYICSCERPAGGGRIVLDLFGKTPYRLFTVGRLDRDTSGLLLVTNDGEFSNQIIHPSSRITKEYLVKCSNEVTDEALKRLSEGGFVEGAYVKPVSVKKVRRGSLRITLAEGRKHEVRILVMKAGLELVELQRIRLGSLTLGKMPSGTYRELTKAELRDLMEAAKVGRQRPLKRVVRPRAAPSAAVRQPRERSEEPTGKIWGHASVDDLGERRRPRSGAGAEDRQRPARGSAERGERPRSNRVGGRSYDAGEGAGERGRPRFEGRAEGRDRPRRDSSARGDKPRFERARPAAYGTDRPRSRGYDAGEGAGERRRPRFEGRPEGHDRPRRDSSEGGAKPRFERSRPQAYGADRPRSGSYDAGEGAGERRRPRFEGRPEGRDRPRRDSSEGGAKPRFERSRAQAYGTDRPRSRGYDAGEGAGERGRPRFEGRPEGRDRPRRDSSEGGAKPRFERSRPQAYGTGRPRSRSYDAGEGAGERGRPRFEGRPEGRDRPRRDSSARGEKPRFERAKQQAYGADKPRMQWEEVPLESCKSPEGALTPRRQKRLDYGKRFKDQGPKRSFAERGASYEPRMEKPRALRPLLRD